MYTVRGSISRNVRKEQKANFRLILPNPTDEDGAKRTFRASALNFFHTLSLEARIIVATGVFFVFASVVSGGASDLSFFFKSGFAHAHRRRG